jgi:hypothetical protein
VDIWYLEMCTHFSGTSRRTGKKERKKEKERERKKRSYNQIPVQHAFVLEIKGKILYSILKWTGC